MADNIIYLQDKEGKFLKVGEPRFNSEKANFLILYEGMDWSNFRTLSGCEKQLLSLTTRNNPGRNEHFSVVERL